MVCPGTVRPGDFPPGEIPDLGLKFPRHHEDQIFLARHCPHLLFQKPFYSTAKIEFFKGKTEKSAGSRSHIFQKNIVSPLDKSTGIAYNYR